jgi:pSer/pThr/pTyr-binding forkhead associated (FHA) protein
MLRLVFRYLSGSKRGQTEIFPASRFSSLAIGRDPKCDVRFDADLDILVSRNHAMIEWSYDDASGFHCVLNDLLSSNGTYLNGEKIGKRGAALNNGDRIQFGRGGPDVQIEIVEESALIGAEEETPKRPLRQTAELPALTELHRAVLLDKKPQR